MSLNDLIIHNLQEMYNLHRYKKDTWKAKAYNDALQLIKSVQTPIKSPKDIESLNLGKKIKEKVLYIIQNKENIPQLTDESDDTLQKINAMNELANIHNIGVVKAKELVEEHGILTFDELLKNEHLLNSKQKQGIKYHFDIQQKIPRSEMIQHDQMIKTIMNKAFPDIKEFSLVGSYRRNKEESGDIDLIVKTKSNFDMNDLVQVLIQEGYIQEDGIFALGKKKFMGMAKLPYSVVEGTISRRLDILFCPASEYAFALLYFTGSKEFNVKMRERAKQLGYRLNEKGLMDENSEKIKNLKSEKDIFKFLKINYVEPDQRYTNNYQEY
uniref:DNA-directed DNA polymerase n=1 Tax=viral metagenome TaxID=1070528 RepID=A0A6C0CUW5_9ZZZZ